MHGSAFRPFFPERLSLDFNDLLYQRSLLEEKLNLKNIWYDGFLKLVVSIYASDRKIGGGLNSGKAFLRDGNVLEPQSNPKPTLNP